MTSRIPFHRAATVLAGALLGLAGTLAATTSASAHTGELTAVSQCTDTGWTATWNLTMTDTDDHEGVLSNVTLNLSYQEVPPGSGGPPKLDRLIDGAKVTGDTTVTDTKKLSPYVTSAALDLTVTWKVGDDLHTKTLHARTDAPTNCNWPPKPEPSRLSTSFDCTTMTITLINPASAVQEVTLRLKSSEGEERILATKPGETKSETFSATVGFTVDVTSASGPQPPGGARPRTIAYEQPANCSTEDGGAATDEEESAGGGAAAGSNDGGGLPVTGAAAGAIAGSAAALLTIGGMLFIAARRRRVKFTP